MKFLHISDLHLGKRLGEYSLYDEQKDILNKILSVADSENPDGLIIAGDIYDKPVPPEDSVQLFDDFLFELSKRKINTFVISGNHDSADRLSFGSRLMSSEKIFISPSYNGKTLSYKMTDEYGVVNIYLLPFVKPNTVRRFFLESNIISYNTALQTVIEAMNINTEERNILVTHQFITGASLSDSEEIFIGGTENIDSGIFEAFDYVALGHIHSPQNINSKVRYSGTPLKYSKSEANQVKSVTSVEISEKGKINISTIPLIPLHDARIIKGSFTEITDKEFYSKINTDDFVYVVLSDITEIPDAVYRLRKIYPRLVSIEYKKNSVSQDKIMFEETRSTDISPSELVEKFYKEYFPEGMNKEQTEYISKVIDEVWGEEL